MWTLDNGYRIREMLEDEFNPLFQKYCKEFFDEANQVFHLRRVFTDDEKARLVELGSLLGKPYTLRLGVFKDDEFVGWHFGYQETALRFYMCNSAIFPVHRKQGLYKQLLSKTLEIVTEKGFQEIYSRHMPTNNAVIIPKLQAGFFITSMQLDDVHGVLVHLTYYPNPVRRKAQAYRSGFIRMDEELTKYF